MMFIDELLKIRLRNQLRRWVPDKFAAELKLAHLFILLSFRAKSRLQRSGPSPRGQAFYPGAKSTGNSAGFFDSAALRSE